MAFRPRMAMKTGERPHPRIEYGAGSNPLPEGEGIAPPRAIFMAMTGGAGSEGDGGFEGAGDDAATGGPGEQGAQELVGLGQEAKVEATLQVVVEVVEALELEAAFLRPPEEDLGPFADGARASPAFCR